MQSSSMHKDELLHSGRWLNLRQKVYPNGKAWEYVNRSRSNGACGIIATTFDKEIILVRQYRPAVNAYVIEFPAGLIDEGETVETTALRELKEETGYEGNIVRIGSPIYSSPGMTNESVVMVEVQITGKGAASPEEDETIEVLKHPIQNLDLALKEYVANGDLLDAKLASFVAGLHFKL